MIPTVLGTRVIKNENCQVLKNRFYSEERRVCLVVGMYIAKNFNRMFSEPKGSRTLLEKGERLLGFRKLAKIFCT